MARDQFSNLLTVATALSLAGYVTRTPSPPPPPPHYQQSHSRNGNPHENIDHFDELHHFLQADDLNPTYSPSFNDIIPSEVLNYPDNPGEDLLDAFSDRTADFKLFPTFSSVDESQASLDWDTIADGASNYALPVSTQHDLVDGKGKDVFDPNERFSSVQPVSPAESDISSLFSLNSQDLHDIEGIDVNDLLNADLMSGLIPDGADKMTDERDNDDVFDHSGVVHDSFVEHERGINNYNFRHMVSDFIPEPEVSSSSRSPSATSAVADHPLNIDEYLRSFIDPNLEENSATLADGQPASNAPSMIRGSESLSDILSGLNIPDSISTSGKSPWGETMEDNPEVDPNDGPHSQYSKSRFSYLN